MAKLVGMISLEHPFVELVRTKGTSYGEQIRDVAFDDEGKAWGLVTRLEPLPDISERAVKLTLHRWVPFRALPFVEADEVWSKLA